MPNVEILPEGSLLEDHSSDAAGFGTFPFAIRIGLFYDSRLRFGTALVAALAQFRKLTPYCSLMLSPCAISKVLKKKFKGRQAF